MAASMEQYEKWLTEKLLSLNPDTDTDVFVSYMTGILEEDGSEEEKKESLVEFIGQVVEDNQEAVYEELMKKWKQVNNLSEENTSGRADTSACLTNHLTNILDQQKIESVKPKEKSAEEIARKKAILENYSTVCSDDEEGQLDDQGGETEAKGDSSFDFKNMNSDLVKMHEQEQREKSKQESEKKKEKDKQDREAQKQKVKDRKETEKKRTQKGEKRR